MGPGVLRRVQVAAVEDTAVQVMWGHAPHGPVTIAAQPVDTPGVPVAEHVLDDRPAGPGGVVVEGLRPATAYRIVVVAGRRRAVCTARTLPSPPGAPLTRIATFSDTHLGAVKHGYFGTMRDRSTFSDPAPVRCTRGALNEAVAWQPDLLVAKGDLTQWGWRADWLRFGELVDAHAGEVPVVATPGNHDIPLRRELDPHDGLALAKVRSDPVTVVDLPGVRVVVVDSSIDGASRGTIVGCRADILDVARDAAHASEALLLCLHHPFEQYPWPTKYPPCIPWAFARRFLRQLGEVNPRVVVTGGHTHRNRRFVWGPVVHTEVGSVKDYPGVWGGYVFHEGGVRQVVRRVMADDALPWIEYSRLAVGGLWQFYAPGRMQERCFTHAWPR